MLTVYTRSLMSIAWHVFTLDYSINHPKAMHMKSLIFKSRLMTIFRQNHYRLVIVPRGHHSVNDTLGNIPSYSRYKSMSTEEKLVRVRDAIARANILDESRISGFHSATAAFLTTVYASYLGDSEIFTFRCYPLICAYIFVPAQRLYEQVGYSPLSHGEDGFSIYIGADRL